MEIVLATMEDCEGFMALHRRYHTDYISDEDRPDGFVTTNFTEEQLRRLIEEEKGLMLAKDESGKVVAYATAAPWEYWSVWPLFAHMIENLKHFSFQGEVLTTENSYQYGPVCIDKAYRSTGLFQEIFHASLASMEDRYPIMATFINQINGRSYRAHTEKVPMTLSGTFEFNGNNYYLMACPTDMKK